MTWQARKKMGSLTMEEKKSVMSKERGRERRRKRERERRREKRKKEPCLGLVTEWREKQQQGDGERSEEERGRRGSWGCPRAGILTHFPMRERRGGKRKRREHERKKKVR